MNPNWPRLTNLLLGLHAAYAVAVLLSALSWSATGIAALQFLATPFGFAAFGLANLLFLVAAFSPRVPLRVVGPLWAWQLYMAVGAMPFGVLMLVNPWHSLWLALGSLAVTAAAFGLARTVGPVDGVWLGVATLGDRPAFAPMRGIAVLGAVLVTAPMLLAVYAAGSAAWSVSYATGGYAAITPQGFVIRSRAFSRGDTELLLQGMMHIGEGDAYEDLYASFAEVPRTVVLTEGVSDEEGLLGLSGGYSKVATRLGLEQQQEIEADGFEVINADVDVSRFSPETLEMLKASFGIWQADDPVRAYLEFSLKSAGKNPEEVYKPIYEDIVVLRNNEVLRHVRETEPDFARIVVPWGAAHLPGLEQALVDDGWQAGAWDQRVLWSWGTVSGAMGR